MVPVVLLALLILVLVSDTGPRPPIKADPGIPVQTHW